MKIHPKTLAQHIVHLAKDLPTKDLPHLMDAVADFLEKRGDRKMLRQLPYHLEKAFRTAHNLTSVSVTSTSDLHPTERKELLESLKKSLEGTIELSEEKDPSLLGGVRIAIGDERFDYSLSSALQEASHILSASL